MFSYSDYVPNSPSKPIKLVVPKLDPNKDQKDYNECEKMIMGLPYFANVDDLLNGRLFAKVMCHKLNTLSPIEPKEPILKDLLGTFSFNCYIEPPFYCDYGSNIHLGKGVYMNHNCCILDVCEVTIGDRTFFAPGVQIYTATHPTDPIKRRNTEYGKPIRIGNDCWIGGCAIILPGITIGDGVTVGAGSVVTRDIEPFTVVVGNPARVIKKLEKPHDYN